KWPRVCPPDSFELGRATWTFLHTMASHYPKVADDAKQTSMRRFLRSFSELYPCAPCAEHLRAEMVRNQPRIGGRAELGTWLCEVHNEVNERLGKATFDCSKIEERWRTGPSDGSCN
ncbi:sulfhydryl oxidase, partial [Ramicandelaber brevisporus]